MAAPAPVSPVWRLAKKEEIDKGVILQRKLGDRWASRGGKPAEEGGAAIRYKANLPCVGIASFLKSPICEDLERVDADVAVLGVPYDVGVAYRPGTRFGPRDVREYSTRYGAWGTQASGYWDINTKQRCLADVRIVDCGDVDIVYNDQEQNFRNVTESVEALIRRRVLPVVIGGDHSITYPVVRALETFGPLDIVHIDAHLDYLDEVQGVRFSSGSPIRRIAELPFIRRIAQLGVRDVRSREENYNASIARGNVVVTREEIRELGVAGILGRLPQLGNVYVTIDVDAMDPSVAPGTSSPTVDGLWYHELRGILRGVAARGRVVGFDFVEVNPLVDPTGQTSLLAVTAVLEFLGAIFAQSR